MNERPAYPPVAIRERVDRFELRVSDRGLQRRGQIVALQEPQQILHEAGDVLRRRRHANEASAGVA